MSDAVAREWRFYLDDMIDHWLVGATNSHWITVIVRICRTYIKLNKKQTHE
ncbi:MAG: hypothetical protein RIR39_1244 [Pseudomonadota bacterium]